jgi:hypothetical protein
LSGIQIPVFDLGLSVPFSQEVQVGIFDISVALPITSPHLAYDISEMANTASLEIFYINGQGTLVGIQFLTFRG